MEIRPIHTQSDCKAALNIVATLVDADPAPGTPDGDRLEVLGTLVTAYEAKHHPIVAIKFRMEQQGLSEKPSASKLTQFP